MEISLQGKVALVTGASRGIGRAIAEGLAEAGAQVVLVSRKMEALQEVAQAIAKKGGRALPLSCHMGDWKAVEKMVQEAEKAFSRLDILVNNAATNPHFGPALEAEEKAFDKILQVNLKGYFFAAKASAPRMQKNGGGVILNIASTAGFSPAPFLGLYAVSKAAVLMLTKVLAQELAPSIRVNALAPGLIQTRLSEAIWKNEAILQEVLKGTALQRAGTPQEVVGAALYLASDAASYVTGATLVIDGGTFFRSG